MKDTQFRVLYRQFLFRMVDIEVLSSDAKGDMGKLFGQFAALLIFISLSLSMVAGVAGGSGLAPSLQTTAEWSGVHFMIATTMLVVGLFAILSWDSTFPDRRDVMVLAPLPIRSRTIFLAKVAAVGTALSVTVAALHIIAGFVWPLALNSHEEAGVVSFLRLLVVWWTTMLMAGAFIYCCLLGAQGLCAQLLSRRHFLRVSSWMQLAAFGILVSAYFLEPKIMTPEALEVAHRSPYLAWSPSYWFLGVFEQLNGSSALSDLARRGWVAIAIAFIATGTAYTLAYLRSMRRIVEEPDIASATGGRNWLPGFGNGFSTAVGQFSVRTLLRSRQHRLLLAFYLGIGFATTILFPQWPVMQDLSNQATRRWGHSVSLALMASTILIMVLSVVGSRVLFSLPMDMRANWIFRITPFPLQPGCMAARRGALYAISVVPASLASAVLLFSIWPWQAAAQHLVLLVLLGTITAELCLRGTQKLPFVCSYLPGKSNFNITFLVGFLLTFNMIAKAAQMEQRSFEDPLTYSLVVAAMAAVAICARWCASRLARSPEGELKFEETAEPAIFALDLHRDGVTQFPPSDQQGFPDPGT